MSSKEVLCNGTIEDEERTGWALSCPCCHELVRYTFLNLTGVEPFLYCTKCSNFVLRREDVEALRRPRNEGGAFTIEEVRQVYEMLENNLPPCPCGGLFKLRANVKCPICSCELVPHQVHWDESGRLFESKVIWVERATAFRGTSEPSNRLLSVKVFSGS